MDELIEHHVLYQSAHLHVEIRSCVQIVEISRINNKLKFLFSLVRKTLFSLNKNTICSVTIISPKLDIPPGRETSEKISALRVELIKLTQLDVVLMFEPINFEHISHFSPVFVLLTLNMQMLAGETYLRLLRNFLNILNMIY